LVSIVSFESGPKKIIRTPGNLSEGRKTFQSLCATESTGNTASTRMTIKHQIQPLSTFVKASLKCHLFVQDRKGTFSLCNHINVTAALSHSTN